MPELEKIRLNASKRQALKKEWLHTVYNNMRLQVDEDLTALQKAIETDYYEYFADDGFFWGHQWQEQSAKEYKDQDIEFVKWANEEIENGNKVFYNSSW